MARAHISKLNELIFTFGIKPAGWLVTQSSAGLASDMNMGSATMYLIWPRDSRCAPPGPLPTAMPPLLLTTRSLLSYRGIVASKLWTWSSHGAAGGDQLVAKSENRSAGCGVA